MRKYERGNAVSNLCVVPRPADEKIRDRERGLDLMLVLTVLCSGATPFDPRATRRSEALQQIGPTNPPGISGEGASVQCRRCLRPSASVSTLLLQGSSG